MELYINSLGDAQLREYIDVKRAMLKTCSLADPKSILSVADGFKKILINYSEIMRKTIHVSPKDTKIVDAFISSTKTS